MLKLITPFRVLFNLDSSKVAAQPALFVEFLKKARAALDDPGSSLAKSADPALEIEFNLPRPKDNASDQARDHGRFFLSPHVIVLRFRSAFREEMERIYAQAAAAADAEASGYSGLFKPDLGSLSIKLNDNTVAVMSLDLGIVGKLPGGEGWNQINAWAGALVTHMLRELYPRMIFPLLKGLNAFSNQTRDYFVHDVSEYKIFFVLVGDPKNPYPDLHKRFIPMDTNLTLCVSEGFEKNSWIDDILHHSVSVHLGGAEIHIGHKNNLAVLPPQMDVKSLEVFWSLVASASYYYIAMNVININLIRYIGITSERRSSEELRLISQDMEKIINAVTILRVRYNDLAFELTGTAKKIFHALQKEWDFKNITDNMQDKLELCRTNINTLSVETQRRNQGRIETVLTGVAGMTILSVFVDLASYATQIPDEKLGMVGDVPGFMDLGFILSGNTLSWIAIVMAALVLMFTIKHRSG